MNDVSILERVAVRVRTPLPEALIALLPTADVHETAGDPHLLTVTGCTPERLAAFLLAHRLPVEDLTPA